MIYIIEYGARQYYRSTSLKNAQEKMLNLMDRGLHGVFWAKNNGQLMGKVTF